MGRILNDWIDSYLVYTNNSEPPTTFRLWSAISLISAVLQRKCKFNWGSLTFYPNMYVVLVGPPAARKGTAMNDAFEFLADLNVKLAAEAITREALIRELKNANDNEIGTEGAGVKMTFHSSLTIWAQELTVFLGYHNLQLMSDLTDWFDCRNQWTYRTKNMGVDDIIGVYVTLFGATTPALIRASMPLDAIGGGLTSRMIFVFEHNKEKLVPYTGLSDEERKLGKDLKDDLAKIHMLHGDFKFEKSFVDPWIEWYVAQEGNPPFKDSRFEGYFERRATHVLKLCMILSASRSDEMVIRVKDLERAVEILELTERKMPNTFSGVGKSSHADTMTRVMSEVAMRKSEGVSFGELLDTFKDDADKWTMEKIVETLIASKFMRRSVTGKDIMYYYIEPDER